MTIQVTIAKDDKKLDSAQCYRKPIALTIRPVALTLSCVALRWE